MYYKLIPKTEVSVSKVWEDADDQDGLRPESITVNLMKNGGEEPVATAELNAENEWTYTFTGLNVYENDDAIEYTVEEIEVGKYETEITGNAAEGYIITNSHTPETIEIEGRKTWIDSDEIEGTRPDSITVNLLADDEVIRTVAVTEADGWAWTFTDLPKYRDHGTEIVYTVTEEKVDGYETGIDGYDITNTIEQEYLEINGVKTWVDPEDTVHPTITINLLQDGTEINEVKLADGETAYSFIDLPKYAPDGHIYEYSVAEDAVPGYTSVKTGNDFTNTVEQVWTDITVTKIWVDDGAGEGVVHPTITIYLLRNGERIAEVQLPDGVTSYTFSNLPTYDLVTGAVYTYSAEEEAVPNYETAIDGMTITNTFIAPEVVDLDITITGTKTWEDDGREHDNASEVQLVLSRSVDGGEEETVTGVVPTWWNNRYYFNDMPRFDEEGRMYRYSVTELPMEGYVAVYEGNNIINRQVYDVLPVEISGTKHWNDNDNAEGTRPESITVQLLRDGELIETVTVTAEDNWSYTFTDLPDNDGFGNYYTYSVGEQMVAGYWLRVEGYDLYNTLFTEEEPGIFGMRNMNEGELEELLTLLGYEVPLWGGLLGTGDELPAYPFVFGGCGLLALAAYIVLNRKSKKA